MKQNPQRTLQCTRGPNRKQASAPSIPRVVRRLETALVEIELAAEELASQARAHRAVGDRSLAEITCVALAARQLGEQAWEVRATVLALAGAHPLGELDGREGGGCV